MSCPPKFRRRNFQTTVTRAGVAGNLSFLIPARYSSLKQLLVTHRNSAGQTSVLLRGSTCLAQPGLTSYQFRVGSVLMPQAPVKSSGDTSVAGWSSEILMEFLRSFHRVGGVDQPASVTLGSWTRTGASGTVGGDQFGSFCIGLELESFANKNDVIMSGISTLGQNVFFECAYNTGGGSYTALVDAFAAYDVLYTLQDGVLTAQF